MKQYLDLLQDIRDNGKGKDDRTGTGTRSVFGRQLRFDLRDGFPATTTKKLFWDSVVHELIWFIRGDTNLRYLAQNNVHIWDDWPYRRYVQETEGREVTREETLTPQWKQGMRQFSQRIAEDEVFAADWGELGPIYGHQWRHWATPEGEIDQLQTVIDTLSINHTSRRMIVSAWNAADITEMARAGLPPCHTMFQFNVTDGEHLDLQLYQRSADTFLGVPFNIASYALLLSMVAQVTGFKPGEFIHTFGDAHIYNNHVDQVNEQLARQPYALPQLWLNPEVKQLDDFTFQDVRLENYKCHPPIKAPIAV